MLSFMTLMTFYGLMYGAWMNVIKNKHEGTDVASKERVINLIMYPFMYASHRPTDRPSISPS